MKKEKKFTFSLWGRSFLTLSMLLVFFAGAFAQTKTITGKITDAKNEPLVGATVIVEGDPTNGVTADFDGNFSINVPQATTKLVISFIGYKPQTVSIEGKTNINVVLQEEAQMIDEVVVVGYGSQKKVNLTGAVGTVDAKVLESRPVQNVSQALQGVVPGLNFSVGNGGGQLDAELNFNIRGAGSIGEGSSSSPLVLIDGMEGNMNSINPNDIESISVLKDASSSAIYGSRAAFGVILITTKSGKAGRTSVSYSGNVRFAKAIQVPEMMDSYHFSRFFNEASMNAGGSPIFNADALGRIDQVMAGEDIPLTQLNNSNKWQMYGGSNANTDWFKEQYKSWVPSHEHNLSISGGSEKITYLISGNFLDQNGLIRHGGDDFQRYTLNGKVNATISDYVKVNYSSKWIREDFERPSYLTGLFFHNIARRWPTVPVRDPNGYYIEHSEIIQLEDGGRQKQQKDYVYQQLQVVIEPIKNWKIYAEGNLKTESTNQTWAVLPVYAHDGNGEPYAIKWSDDYPTPGTSRFSEWFQKDNFLGLNVYTDYFKQLGDHYFKVMVGFNGEELKRRNLSGRMDGLITPSVPSLNTATTNPRTGDGYNEWSTAGFFGRINYNYKEKYLLELNGRYDGTSRFIGDKRWGFFPSFSAGWNIAREGFWENWTSYVNTLKLRGSWGQLGNMNTEAWYPFYQTMPTGTASGGWLIDGEKPNTAGVPGIVSANMTWEKVESWDIGFDWGAFNNRFTGSFDYFKRTTKDMIGPAPMLPSILGTSVPKVNNADMESSGFELELSWRDRIRDFNYGVKVVLSDDRQKVTRYPGSGSLNEWYAGRRNNIVWGYKTKGIAKTQAEMDAHLASLPNGGQTAIGTGWRDGDIMFEDVNKDGKIDNGSNNIEDHGDLVVIADQTPRYKYGITIDASWKGIDFSVFFQGVGKRDYVLGGPYFWGAVGDEWQSAGFKEHWNFFREEGNPLGANLNAYYPRPYFGYKTRNQQRQTRYVQDASYIRLKNIQLGYTLPKKWTDAIRLQSVRVYVSGDNLWTKSDISGVFDPETLGGDWGEGKIYPLSKTISAGINVNF